MFTLKIFKIQNLICKQYANEQHEKYAIEHAIIISMFIEAC